jgi:RNA polymerase sigma factor (sigma-70 family)
MAEDSGRQPERLAWKYRQSQASETFTELYQIHHQEVLNWTEIKLNGRRTVDADGLVNMAYAELNKILLDPRVPIPHIKKWLFSYLHRRLLAHAKRLMRKKHGGQHKHISFTDHLVSCTRLAEEIETRDIVTRAKTVWSKFPVGEQAALVAVYEENLTHAEAASLLEIPLGTLKTRWRSGLSRLRLAFCA